MTTAMRDGRLNLVGKCLVCGGDGPRAHGDDVELCGRKTWAKYKEQQENMISRFSIVSFPCVLPYLIRVTYIFGLSTSNFLNCSRKDLGRRMLWYLIGYRVTFYSPCMPKGGGLFRIFEVWEGRVRGNPTLRSKFLNQNPLAQCIRHSSPLPRD